MYSRRNIKRKGGRNKAEGSRAATRFDANSISTTRPIYLTTGPAPTSDEARLLRSPLLQPSSRPSLDPSADGSRSDVPFKFRRDSTGRRKRVRVASLSRSRRRFIGPLPRSLVIAAGTPELANTSSNYHRRSAIAWRGVSQRARVRRKVQRFNASSIFVKRLIIVVIPVVVV